MKSISGIFVVSLSAFDTETSLYVVLGRVKVLNRNLCVISCMVVVRPYNDISRPSDFKGQLMYLYDSGQGVFRPVQATDLLNSLPATGSNTVNTSSVSGSNGVCLQENAVRNSYFIQNLSTGGALFVKLGSGASPTSFNFILKADDGTNNANGGSWSDDVWKGRVSCSGLGSVSYIAWEI